ncbi:MAG: hypothetical protein WAZ34_02400 [Rhodocyclaceae bacterium]
MKTGLLKRLPLGIAASTLILSGCAGLGAPGGDEMARIPTIRFGEAAPAGKDFVLHYPAGSPLPVVTGVFGSLFEQAEKATLDVRLKRDVFIYRKWVSFDGKSWLPGNEAVNGKIELKLPGEADGQAPGRLSAEFNLK